MSANKLARWIRSRIYKASLTMKKGMDVILGRHRKEALAAIILYSDSPMGRRFDKLIIALIVASVMIVIVETMPNIPRNVFWVLFVLEWIIAVIFTVEYLIRIYVQRNPLRYIFSFYGVVDLLSFLPTYISYFVPGTQHLLVIRVLRLLRIFRIFKLGHFVSEGGVVVDALKASRVKIEVFFTFIILVSILIGTMMYMVENPYNPSFESIPSGIYWAIVTVTTVGYGDVIPVTYVGRLLSTIVMILGYGVLAVPTGIVTAEISNRVLKSEVRDNRVCRNCGKTGHVLDARYCHHCSAELSQKTN